MNSSTASDPGTARPLVLIVDDQPQMRRLLEATLKSHARLRLACDGAQALEELAREIPDVLLLDLMMPGEPDGLQLLARLRSDPAHDGLSIALITARAQVTDRARGHELGADAYFAKPFSPQEVRAWVLQVSKGKTP